MIVLVFLSLRLGFLFLETALLFSDVVIFLASKEYVATDDTEDCTNYDNCY